MWIKAALTVAMLVPMAAHAVMLVSEGADGGKWVSPSVVEARCNGLGFAGLKAEKAGGNSYYFELEGGKVIAACGGACKGREAACKQTCPPKAWTCPAPQSMKVKK